jgi:hypothetical protein
MHRPVHLVGSVPLENSAEVMTTCCSILGERLARIPDGETGIRSNWIQWQREILGSHPAIHLVGEGKNAETAMPRFAVRKDYPDELVFSDLGYLAAAAEGYETYKLLKKQGKIGNQRFQVSLPTPLAAIACYVEAGSQESIFPAYKDRLLTETRQIIETIDETQLAIQWDVAIEFAILEGLFPVWFGAPFNTIASQLTQLVNIIPPAVEVGFHFCYGDAGNKHFKEPHDMGLLTKLANEVTKGADRAIDWIHMPVPIDREDADYFRPLGKLEHGNLRQLFLGLLHEQDGIEGAKRRMAAADRFINDYGVATECGLGRRKPEIVAQLLKLHAAL